MNPISQCHEPALFAQFPGNVHWFRGASRENSVKGRGENEGFRFGGVGFMRTVVSPLNKKLVRKSLGLSKVFPIFVITFLPILHGFLGAACTLRLLKVCGEK